ncbi:MAG: hypothetical protein IPL75_15800 [Acidobacteria bacterium]|nr:hypothetical protein [Acidobacteriota bacterium]
MYFKRLKESKVTKTLTESVTNSYVYYEPKLNINSINFNFKQKEVFNNFTFKNFFKLPENNSTKILDKLNVDYYKALIDTYNAKKVHKGYNNSILDNTIKFSSNVLDSVKVVPFTFIKGTLNKHNVELLLNSTQPLKKNIFLTAKFFLNNGALEPKTKKGELF